MSWKARLLVAAIILIFAWRDAASLMSWIPRVDPGVPKPPAEILELASPLRDVLPKMTPKDRIYLASFYDAMAHILVNDGERENSIIADTEKFATFHAGSLRLAINRRDVGKYDGLGEAIDLTFVAAAGADVQALTPAVRARLVSACGALSWAFTIGRDS